MAAGEDELQAFVGKRRCAHGHLGPIACEEQGRLRGEGPVATDPVRRSVPSRRDQPGAGVGGDALARPSIGGDGERLLRGLLGEVEVPEEADQRGQDAAPFFAEDLIEGRYQ